MQISRGVIEGAQKITIYGPEGIGKSYFASKFPNPVFIDTEGSTKHMDVARLPKPTSWTMLMEEVKYVKQHPETCDTLVVDTADWAERLCMEEICAKSQKTGIEDFGYGKGYVYLAEEFGRLLNALTELIDLGINVVMVAHAQMRKFEQPDEMGAYDRWEMKLQKKTAPMVKEWADMVLFANYKTYVVNVDGQGAEKGTNKARGGKRVMYTTHHPCWDAKNRHDLLDELELHYSEIAHCIPSRGGAVEVKKQPQQTTKATQKDIEDFEKLVEDKKPEKTDTANATKQEPPKQEAKSQKADWSDVAKQPEPNLPRALLDLMKQNSVTVQEIQRAVAGKGYYPIDTPVENYDPGFIEGVLVGAWGQVFQMIENSRNEIPL